MKSNIFSFKQEALNLNTHEKKNELILCVDNKYVIYS